MEALSSLAHLTTLTLAGCPLLQCVSLHSKFLEVLDLSEVPQLSELSLHACANLRRLLLTDASVTRQALLRLGSSGEKGAALTRLEALELGVRVVVLENSPFRFLIPSLPFFSFRAVCKIL